MKSKLLNSGFLILALLAGGLQGGETSSLKSDEEILFYPSIAVWNPVQNLWSIRIHGQVFEPAEGEVAKLRLSLVRRLLGKRSIEGPERELFEQRARPFVVDHERGKTIVIRIEDKSFLFAPSQPNGHFRGTISLPLPASYRAPLNFKAVLEKGDERCFGGRIIFMSPAGLSIISDIDDTVKMTGVGDVSRVIDSTFCKPFQAFPGMARLYLGTIREGGTFFVTGSPWQLYESLWEFLQTEGFPVDNIHMRQFRLTDSSLVDFFAESKAFKIESISRIIADNPGQRFILVGDSGEHDPEVYAAVYAQFPKQVVGIAIRLAGNMEKRMTARLEHAFQKVPGDHWCTFEDVADIQGHFREWSLKEKQEPVF